MWASSPSRPSGDPQPRSCCRVGAGLPPGQTEVLGTTQGCGAPRWPAWEQLPASVLGCRLLHCEPLLLKGAREF